MLSLVGMVVQSRMGGSWNAEARVLESRAMGSPCRDTGTGEGTRTPLWEAVTSLQEWRVVRKMLGLRLLEPDRSKALTLLFFEDCLYVSRVGAAVVTAAEIRHVPAAPGEVVFLMRPGGEAVRVRGEPPGADGGVQGRAHAHRVQRHPCPEISSATLGWEEQLAGCRIKAPPSTQERRIGVLGVGSRCA